MLVIPKVHLVYQGGLPYHKELISHAHSSKNLARITVRNFVNFTTS